MGITGWFGNWYLNLRKKQDEQHYKRQVEKEAGVRRRLFAPPVVETRKVEGRYASTARPSYDSYCPEVSVTMSAFDSGSSSCDTSSSDCGGGDCGGGDSGGCGAD